MYGNVDVAIKFFKLLTEWLCESMKMNQSQADPCGPLKKYRDGWRTESCDVEAAFLEPSMDNPMYIEPHPAMVACGFITE